MFNRKKSLRHGALLLISALALGATPTFAQQWEAVSLRTPTQRNVGIGGEGAQWPQGLAIDSTGNFLLFGTDVGGLYRSLDGGTTWEPCNVGYNARGNTGFAIDPNNNNRCLSVAANSGPSYGNFHGLYLSTNQGASWSQVVARDEPGYRDVRDQIAYAKNSLSGGASQTVYWASSAGGLYKSTNAGVSWAQLSSNLSDANEGASILKVNPNNGNVYLGNTTAFYRSTNGGTSFSNTLTGAVQGLDVQGNNVYVSKTGGVWRSTSSGSSGSFTKLTGTNLPTTVPLRNLKVHPTNTNFLLVVADFGDYDKRIYYSSNGGSSWTQGSYNNSGAFLPFNARLQLFAWHPSNTSTAWSFGGDWITKTTNSGATFSWAANGYNGICVGGQFNFNPIQPNVWFISSQDYNGSVTSDSGDSWTYCNVSGNGWGGFEYGGFGIKYSDTNETVLWSGDTPSWGGTRTLKVSRNGGTSWFNASGPGGSAVTFGGSANKGRDISLTDPSWWWVSFAGNWRTEDRAYNWTPMTACDGVLTASAVSSRLFGVKYNTAANTTNIVTSTDHGITWQSFGVALPGEVADIAVGRTTSNTERVFIVNEDKLKSWDTGVSGAWTNVTTLTDQWGTRHRTVATDPQNLSVVYVGSSRDIFSSSVAVQRSTDNGGSWTNLSVSSPLTTGVKDGGREAVCIRVHPTTRYAYVSTSCYGIWKIAAP